MIQELVKNEINMKVVLAWKSFQGTDKNKMQNHFRETLPQSSLKDKTPLKVSSEPKIILMKHMSKQFTMKFNKYKNSTMGHPFIYNNPFNPYKNVK